MWSVFALTFGLMLSDYLTRNVMGAVFPMLKAEWSLSDSQLGALVSVVALVVGIGAVPIALLADRWGRVKSITVMAGMWCLATIGCGLAQSHTQLLVARGFVGLGEAGYGAAGSAILAHVFPPERRAMVLGAFLAAALFGSVAGVAIGGIVAAQYGWRIAFIGVGAASLILVVLYPLVVRDYKSVPLTKEDVSGTGTNRQMRLGEIVKELFVFRTTVFTYAASGLQMFVPGAMMAWLPTYFSRVYALAPDKAAVQAALVIAVLGIGMIVGGSIADRLGRRDGRNKLRVPAVYAVITCVLLMAAFLLPAGHAQLALLYSGVFLAGGHSGAAGAAIMDVVHPGLRATAAATIVLGNNLLGLAPAPWVVGRLSDSFGLQTAMAAVPAVSLAAAVCFIVAARHYASDCRTYEALRKDLDGPVTFAVH
jgi:MFS family permease